MSHAVQPEKPNVSSSAALWSVLIFVGLIVAAINFVQAESKSADHGHGGHGAATEQHGGAAHGKGHEAAGGHEAAQPEHGAEHAEAPATHDTAKHESHDHEAPAAGHATEEAHH